MTHGAHSPCGVARTKTRWISPSLACPRPMSGSTERVLIAPPSGAWPIPAHADVRSTTSRASDRSNTHFRRTLVYLLARSRGGHNRCRILKLLQEDGPLNANQIASALGLHYTTVQHHLAKLQRDDVIATSPRGDTYGALFFLTYQMERNAEFLGEILPGFDWPAGAARRPSATPSSLRVVSQ